MTKSVWFYYKGQVLFESILASTGSLCLVYVRNQYADKYLGKYVLVHYTSGLALAHTVTNVLCEQYMETFPKALKKYGIEENDIDSTVFIDLCAHHFGYHNLFDEYEVPSKYAISFMPPMTKTETLRRESSFENLALSQEGCNNIWHLEKCFKLDYHRIEETQDNEQTG